MKTFTLFIVSLCLSINFFGQAGEAHFILAGQNDDAGQFKTAIEEYTKCIELEPNLAEAYFNRGHSKFHLKDYYGAIGDLLIAMKLKPALSALALSDIALYKYNVQDYKGAIEDCSKAIELNPNVPEAYTNRALSKRALKQDFCDDLKKAKDMGEKQAIKYYPLDCK